MGVFLGALLWSRTSLFHEFHVQLLSEFLHTLTADRRSSFGFWKLGRSSGKSNTSELLALV